MRWVGGWEDEVIVFSRTGRALMAFHSIRSTHPPTYPYLSTGPAARGRRGFLPHALARLGVVVVDLPTAGLAFYLLG